MRNVWIFVAAAAAIAAGGAGYLIGRSQARTASILVGEEDGETRERPEPAPSRDDQGGDPESRERPRPAPATDPARTAEHEPAPPADAPSPAGAAAFSLEGVSEAAELSKRLMDFADDQLGRGDEGYLALLQALHEMTQNKDLLRSLGEEQMVRELYPWIRFLVEHERETVGMAEWVFKSLAERPSTFAEIDDDVLEIFTEGLGALLPGAVSPEHLDVLRGYAEKFLAIPEDQLPERMRRHRRDVERLLQRFWATPASQAEQIERLRAGTLAPDVALELLARVPSAEISGADVTSVVESAIGRADWRLSSVVARHRSLLDFARLDRALADAFASGKNVQPFFVRQYFEASGRKAWSEVQSFFDTALSGTAEKGRHAAAMALYHLPEELQPPATYVADVLARYDLGAIASALRTRHGLK